MTIKLSNYRDIDVKFWETYLETIENKPVGERMLSHIDALVGFYKNEFDNFELNIIINVVYNELSELLRKLYEKHERNRHNTKSFENIDVEADAIIDEYFKKKKSD